MTTKIYTKIDKNLVKEWMQLWNKLPNANYINGPQWTLSVTETFKYTDIKIVTIYKRGKLSAVAPFVKVKKYGLTFYCLLPEDFVYNEPFLLDKTDSKLASLLVREIEKLGNVFVDNVNDDTKILIEKKSRFSAFYPYNKNYYLPIKGSLQNIIKNSTRKHFLRGIRSTKDRVQLTSYTGKDSNILSSVFEIDSSSRKKAKGYDAFSDNLYKVLYLNLAKRLGKHLVIHVLTINDRNVAYSIGFLIKGVFVGNQMAFNEKYSHYSPGKILLVKLIDDLVERKIDLIDMGSGDGFIKKELSKGYKILYKGIISKNIITRIYIYLIYFSKQNLYSFLNSNTHVYSSYRKIRKILKI